MSIENGKAVIHAVHKRDAKKFWSSLELKKVEKCFICGKDVTWESFGAISPWIDASGKRIVVLCEDLNCVFEFNIKKRNKMIGVSS